MPERPAPRRSGLEADPSGAPQAVVAAAPRRRRTGPGGAPIAFGALAAFLAVLAVLATQLRDDPRSVRAYGSVRPRVVLLRRIYQTVIRERVVTAPGGAAGTTVSSSGASVSGAAPPAPGPSSLATRSS